MSDLTLFKAIDQLMASLPLDPDKVGLALGVRLVRDPDADTPAIEAWALPATTQGGAYAVIDLRMPDPDIGDGSVFLSATPREDGGLDGSAIGAHYGLGFKTEIPSPRFPAGSVPVYLVYERDWGTLSFGVTADSERKLVRFVMSTNRPAVGGA